MKTVVNVVVIGSLAACGSPERAGPGADAGVPVDLPAPDTFCYTVGGVETCLREDAVLVSHGVDEGHAWFRIAASTHMAVTPPVDARIVIDGEVAVGAVLPTAAGRLVIAAPVVAHCHHVQQIDPFGTCALREADVACTPDLTGTDGELLVLALDDRSIGGRFHGQLVIDELACCASSPGCAAPQQWLDPVALDVTGQFLQQFDD